MTDTASPHGFTIADLEAMPDDGRRYELIGGSIVVSPSPTPRHQRASFHLQRMIFNALPPEHQVFNAPIDLDLPWQQRVVPDLVAAPNSSVGEKRLELPVLLIVEIVSPSSTLYDRNVKADAYAQAGIDHYWILDSRPGHDRFTALVRRGDAYEIAVESTERIDVEVPVPVHVTLDELLG